MNDFGYWLLNEMNTRGLTQTDLGYRARVSQATISHVLNHRRMPSATLCGAIARSLRISPETVFRAAGLLPSLPVSTNDDDHDLGELRRLYSQMTDGEKEEYLATARLVVELRLARTQNTKIAWRRIMANNDGK